MKQGDLIWTIHINNNNNNPVQPTILGDCHSHTLYDEGGNLIDLSNAFTSEIDAWRKYIFVIKELLIEAKSERNDAHAELDRVARAIDTYDMLLEDALEKFTPLYGTKSVLDKLVQ